jgi:hypothetical protein
MPSISSIKKKILRQRGIGSMSKGSRTPVSIADTPAVYHKTVTMKLMEIKYSLPIDQLIFEGTIYEAGKRLRLAPSTISKWRRRITLAKEKAFWSNFKKEVD